MIFEKIQIEYEHAHNALLKQHLADVLRTAYWSNEDLFEKMKEEGKMGEKFDKIFDKQIQEAAEKKEERIVANLLKMNEPVDKIVQACEWPAEKVMSYAKRIGVTTLTL